MPFGAEVLADGRVRFRLWAPQAQNVYLCLESKDGDSQFPMEKVGRGWHQLSTSEACPGSLYRYQIDGGLRVPDPVSRFQPADVHGPSEVIWPLGFEWQDEDWKGRPWEDAVLYELHVGTFTPEGTFTAACARLDYPVDLCVTAVELMPVADFPGGRNWGYDGVLLFAPDSSYGRPEDLKHFVQTAHQKGLMVFLDVVYNHFGPEGNYLHVYAKSFFTERHHTPWGAAINFDGPESRTVRDFFIHNALYWLEEYYFDGLRIDAVHAVRDDSHPDILEELAQELRRGPGMGRHVHLALENDNNASRYLTRDAKGNPTLYTAQWNDDIHHSLHCLVTGESAGYYGDYADRPARHLGRCLAEGFAYQGEPSQYRSGASRGEPTGDLPPTAFVSFLQNHDQVGNRAFGERITRLAEEPAVRAAVGILLLAPSPPLLFMGEEFASLQPFLFFCNFGPDLADSVTEGRRREFKKFPEFKDAEARVSIPDPNSVDTFKSAVLDWNCLKKPFHQDWLSYYRRLLALRRKEIIPRLRGTCGGSGGFRLLDSTVVQTHWTLADGSTLTLVANLGNQTADDINKPEGVLLFESQDGLLTEQTSGRMPPWFIAWFLKSSARGRHTDE
jgi:malto-oligosyltrehalose trehalohydrolase